MPKHRVIIDTDPGVDDVLALLLALSASPEELEVLLISVTYGNVDVQSCVRNVVTLFHQIDREIHWRKSQGRDPGFPMLKTSKPTVAVGAEEPLADQILMADYFHGIDGLGGIHESHPHLSPEKTWHDILTQHKDDNVESLFIPSAKPAHEEILRLLRENEPDTLTLVAVGPLTNFARAAAEDPETFLRAREVVVMGGAVDVHGNITPVAEFNTYADTIAAARIFALTSPDPASTMPPTPPAPSGQVSGDPPPPFLAPYPKGLSRQLRLTLFPLDITTPHLLTRALFNKVSNPLLKTSPPSPLAQWTSAFLSSTFRKMESLYEKQPEDGIGLQLHDPLTIWYLISTSSSSDDEIETHKSENEKPHREALRISGPQDIRIETAGQWTRGMCVVDRRCRKAVIEGEGDIETIDVDGEKSGQEVVEASDSNDNGDDGTSARKVEAGDHGRWLSPRAGNRVYRAVGSICIRTFGASLLGRVFGVEGLEARGSHSEDESIAYHGGK